MTKENIVTIIGARGGSKGLPRKNIRPLAGHPLIAYTIEAAKDSELIDRIIVSTDDKKIAEIAKEYGAEVPFMRPEELATDRASSESYLKHAVNWLEENEDYKVDIVVYLQLTDLFRKKGMIDKTIKKLLNDKKLESCFVAFETHKKYWEKEEGNWTRLTAKGHGPRQEAKYVYREDTGIACATRVKIVKKGMRLGDNVEIIKNNDDFSGIDIHEKDDLWLAEQVVKREREKEDSKYYLWPKKK